MMPLDFRLRSVITPIALALLVADAASVPLWLVAPRRESIALAQLVANTAWGDEVAAPPKKIVPKITVSRETTWATEPLDKNGFVDFFEVINRRYSAGVTIENNAVVSLYRAFGPMPGGGRQPDEFWDRLGIDKPDADDRMFFFLEWLEHNNFDIDGVGRVINDWDDQSQSRPWKRDEFPKVAEWLDDMAEKLEHVVEATERPEYFTPVVSNGGDSLFDVLLPGVQSSRNFARALVSRAMLSLGEGRRLDAWRDLMVVHRLGRLFGRGPFLIDGLVGLAIERMAIDAELLLISETQPSAKYVAMYRKQLDRLPPMSPMAEKIDIAERLGLLDACHGFASGRMSFEDTLNSNLADLEHKELREIRRIVETVLVHNIDWDEVLRSVNRSFDRVQSATRLLTYRERVAVLATLNDELAQLAKQRQSPLSLLVIFADRPTQTRFAADAILSAAMPSNLPCLRAESKAIQQMRNLNVALALSAYRSEHAEYPKSLDVLVPKYVPAAVSDLFTDQPLRYRIVGNGYLLYSVGHNGTDDDGQGEDEKPSCDDLPIKMPIALPKP